MLDSVNFLQCKLLPVSPCHQNCDEFPPTDRESSVEQLSSPVEELLPAGREMARLILRAPEQNLRCSQTYFFSHLFFK